MSHLQASLTEFSNTITLGGVILAALATTATIVGIMYGTRYRVAFEAASHAADELRKALTDAEARVETLEKEVASLREIVQELRRRPDLTALRMVIDAHEKRADSRHQQTLQLIDSLSRR